MAVCLTDDEGPAHERFDDDITQPLGRRKAMKTPSPMNAEPTRQTSQEAVGVSAVAPSPPPAALSASGIYRPLPGVDRSVTGLHMPALQKAQPGREWYAAFGGRARGPFSETELRYLAGQGRVRSSTLVWRPGFPSWRRVKGEGLPDDVELSWLREVVRERKLQERLATDKAARHHGIVRLHLEDFSSPPKTPPPLPPEDPALRARQAPVMFVGKHLPEVAADRVFGVPELGEPRLSTVAFRRRRRRHRLLACTAGALWAALAIVVVTYTLPALHLSLMPLVEALGAGRL